MELQTVETALHVGYGSGLGIFRRADGDKPARQLGHLVAVAVPHLELARQSGEEASGARHGKFARTELAAFGGLDRTAEIARQQLHAVANTEDGQAEFVDVAVDARRALGINTGRAAGKNDALRPAAPDFLRGGVMRENLRVDTALADAARDDLGVLRPEVENGDLRRQRRVGRATAHAQS